MDRNYPEHHHQVRLYPHGCSAFGDQVEGRSAISPNPVDPELLIRAHSHKIALTILGPGLVSQDGVAPIGERDRLPL